MALEESIQEAGSIIKKADALLISAGAGMGTDSGVPSFDSEKNFKEAYPEWQKAGISYGFITDPKCFRDNPTLAWAFYGHRLNLYRTTEPHQGFTQLLKIAETKTDGGYFVFTSNVDGHFQKAGYSEDRIEECLGSVHHLQCSVPCSNKIWSAEYTEIKIDADKLTAQEPLPRCKKCGAIARPNMQLLGDWYWNHHRTEAQSHHFGQWIQSVHERGMPLAILEIGAGTSIANVRAKSGYLAEWYNAKLVRINPKHSNVPPGHISIPLGAAEGIQRIYDAMGFK